MDALVLAGGATPPELAQGLSPAQNDPDRALVRLNSRPMLEFTLAALRDCPSVQRIAIAGTPAVLKYLQEHHPQVLGVPAGERMVENAVIGCKALREQPNASGVTLITTCDIPLVSGATYEEFLRGFQAKNLQASYAIVTRQSCEAAYPGGKRTYANLKDGTYTAGNAVIVAGSTIEKLASLFEKFYRVRKNPYGLAKILGPKFLWKALRRQLTVPELEAYLSNLVGARFGAVEMHDASIAFDVDKIADYHVAESTLAKSNLATSVLKA